MARISRREFLKSTAVAGVGASATLAMPAIGRASSTELVICSPGGSYTEAQREAMYKPFEREFNVKVIETGPTDYGKLKAMALSGNMEWDVFDGTGSKHFAAVAEGLLEPLDFQTIDVKDVMEDAIDDYGVGVIYSSTVIGYNKTKYPDGNHPKSWAEFWDVANFPGARTLQRSPTDNLVFALLADGVPKEEIYPLDLDRAFRKLDEIKQHVGVWWATGAQSEQVFVNNEVDVGAIWNGRAAVVAEQGAPIALDWNEGQMQLDYWSIPKGAPNRDLAMKYIAFATLPEQQAALVSRMPYGPVNRKAFDLIDPALLANMPSSDANLSKQIVSDGRYWAEHADEINNAWQAWIIK